MAVNTTGVTPAVQFLQTMWDTETGDAVQANVVLLDLVDNQYEAKLRMGRTIRIVDKSNPAVRIKAEDTTATWSNITETAQDVTVSRQAYVAFLIEDIAEVQSEAELRADYTGKAGYSLSAFMEGDATSGLASLPSSFSQLVGTLGSDVADDDMIEANRLLNSADAPRDGRFCYASPGIEASFLKIDKYTRQDYVGQGDAERAVKKARVGRIYNADVYVSTLAENNPAAASQSYGWFCHKRGVALIRQRRPTTHAQYIILETGWGVLVDCIYQFAERLIAPKTLGGGTSVDTHNVGIRGI